MDTVWSSITRFIFLMLATISTHLNLFSRKRAKGNHRRLSFSKPEFIAGVSEAEKRVGRSELTAVD